MNRNPYSPPTAHVSDQDGPDAASQDPEGRGWALNVFLIWIGLGSLFSIIYYSGLFGFVLPPRFPGWIMRTFLVVSILRLTAAIAIWYWLRVGVVLYAALTLSVLPITLSQGSKLSLFSLLGVALLIYLVRRKWPYMRWTLLPPDNRLERSRVASSVNQGGSR